METEINALTQQENFLEIIVTDAIQQLGIPAHIRGYWYLRYALILCIENSEMITSIGKLLYPAVAEKFGITPSRVNTNIAHAIEIAWVRGDPDVQRSYFGNMLGRTWRKPSVAEFISIVSDTLRIRIKKKNFSGKF